MSDYILSPKARREIKEIWYFIAQDDLEAADRWIAKLVEAFHVLARNPDIGHERTDLTDRPVLFWPVGKYLIVYKLQNNRIRIIAVTQGSRDMPSYLRKRFRAS
jgi:plasmid stabilization system protein ParE